MLTFADAVGHGNGKVENGVVVLVVESEALADRDLVPTVSEEPAVRFMRRLTL